MREIRWLGPPCIEVQQEDMVRIGKCPVCQGGRVRKYYVGRTARRPADQRLWDVWHCDACDHGFLSPQPSWEELGSYYNSGYPAYEPEHGWDPKVVDEARKTGVCRHVHIRPGMRILDVGCGGGAFIRVARDLGAKVVGIEPSDDGVRACRGAELDVFHGTLDDYVNLRAGDAQFDLITFSHVLEHVPDPVGTLRQAGRLLHDDGVLWVSIPNSQCMPARWLGWKWHSTDLPFHLMQFCRASIEVAVQRAGLHLLRVESYSLPEGVRFSLRQILCRKFKVPGRIAEWLMSRKLAHRYAARLGQQWDQACAGEALLVQMRRACSITTDQ